MYYARLTRSESTIFRNHMPALPVFIIALRIVAAEVGAARFVALAGGGDHEPRDREQVLQLPAAAVVELAGQHVAAPELNVPCGFVETTVIADDAHLAHH